MRVSTVIVETEFATQDGLGCGFDAVDADFKRNAAACGHCGEETRQWDGSSWLGQMKFSGKARQAAVP